MMVDDVMNVIDVVDVDGMACDSCRNAADIQAEAMMAQIEQKTSDVLRH